MTDPTKYPLKFPNWFIPYLEKHRILELFHEIARELIIHKPVDHILFMKQILTNAADSRNFSRMILLSSEKVNRILLATEIAKCTKQLVITFNDLKNLFGGDLEPENAQTIAIGLVYLVKSEPAIKHGWIIADCVNTEDVAKNLLKYGILPTHVFLIIPPFQPKLNELIYCDIKENWPKTRHNLFALKQIFHSKIYEVYTNNKTVLEIIQLCIDMSKLRKPFKPIRPRVVILGPRGCGKNTQAVFLAKSLGLIHIKFEYILRQAWTADNEISMKLRHCGKELCLHAELLCQIVNKRILEDDCLENGWVLTGYPHTEIDFKLLDSLHTPPNRVVILDCDLNICKDRIKYKDFKITNLLSPNEIRSNDNLETHPKDMPQLIDAEHQFYCENYYAIKKYCGTTAIVVNGDQNEKWVHECIVAYILGDSAPGPPRKSFGKNIPKLKICECGEIPNEIAKMYAINL